MFHDASVSGTVKTQETVLSHEERPVLFVYLF